MIRVARTPEPEILIKKASFWLNAYLKAISDYEESSTKANFQKLKNAEIKYKHSNIKKSLNNMFSGKCAYCESQIRHIDYGQIEHYKPKSKFPELCFTWDNLMLSCSVCNGASNKGDKFPDENEGGPIINPVEEEPENMLEFEYDPDTSTANILGKSIRAWTTIKILGLNRSELVQRRSKYVKMMAITAINASKGDIEAKELILKCRILNEEYSAFARMLCEKFNIV